MGVGAREIGWKRWEGIKQKKNHRQQYGDFDYYMENGVGEVGDGKGGINGDKIKLVCGGEHYNILIR